MNKKQMNKIKYCLVSCIVAFSLIICVNAPVTFKAAVSDYLGGYNSSNNFILEFSPTSNTCIDGSVVVFDGYYADGTVYDQYTLFEAFQIIGSVKCLNPYSAMRCYISSFNFSVVSSQYVKGMQFVFGTYEELRSGNYHTILASDGLVNMTILSWDETIFHEYGTGEEIYLAFVFDCYTLFGTGYTSTKYPNISFGFSGTIELLGYDVLGASDLIYQKLDDIYGANEQISADLESIYQSTENVSGKLSTLLTYIRTNNNTLSSINSSINNIAEDIESVLDYLSSINDSLGDVNNELDTQTSWLDKIWQSLQELLNLSSDKQQEQDNINNSVNGSLGNLGDLSNDLNFDKPDVGDINVNVNQYIPQGDIDNYSVLLKIFTEHSVVKDMLLISFTVCIVSYTLFGKKR